MRRFLISLFFGLLLPARLAVAAEKQPVALTPELLQALENLPHLYGRKVGEAGIAENVVLVPFFRLLVSAVPYRIPAFSGGTGHLSQGRPEDRRDQLFRASERLFRRWRTARSVSRESYTVVFGGQMQGRAGQTFRQCDAHPDGFYI